jgi:quercetin dioxygenase-like cupin family protein
MKNHRLTIAVSFAFALLPGSWGAPYASAQAPAGLKRVELTRHDLAAAKGHEAVLARADFPVGGAAPKHTHPGDEVAYVLEGELTLELAGKPPVILKAGDSVFVPAGTVHSARNTGKGETKILSTYIIEKGKPIATPVAK